MIQHIQFNLWRLQHLGRLPDADGARRTLSMQAYEYEADEGDEAEQRPLLLLATGQETALLVEALTSTPAATTERVRAAVSDFANDVRTVDDPEPRFVPVGAAQYAFDIGDPDLVFEVAVEAGADNVLSSDTEHLAIAERYRFPQVFDELEELLATPDRFYWSWLASACRGGDQPPSSLQQGRALFDTLARLDAIPEVVSTGSDMALEAATLRQLLPSSH